MSRPNPFYPWFVDRRKQVGPSADEDWSLQTRRKAWPFDKAG